MSEGQGRAKARSVRHGLALGAAIVVGVLGGGRAWAGGFEAPGIGVEAMGRGGAFTAKADDGSALEYNIAGLARQRGTRLLLEGKLVLNKYEFTRSGMYPTEMMGGAMTPWSGMPYPTVASNGLSGAPLLALSTDFGILDRWTFAIGIITPSASDASRTFPTTVNGNWPAPQRYDLIHAKLLVFYPTLAAAVRVTRWFDLGLALELVYGHFDLAATAYADLGTLCPGKENSQCDSALNINTKGFTATGALGLMFHPLDNLHLGVHVRGPVYLNTSGDVTATAPAVLPTTLDPGNPDNPAKATLPFRLPWVVRLGLRYAIMEGKREAGDFEVNGTYESWKEAQKNGDVLDVPQLGPFSDVKATLVHRYKDTGSFRMGGQWNWYFDSNASKLSVRAGFFYDSSSTRNAYTRLDFDTLDKIGLSLGLGYKIRGVTINAAYTFITSPGRLVNDKEGRQQIINGTNGTTDASDGNPTPVFNNGKYNSQTHLILLGLNFAFDELLRKPMRKDPFGDQPEPPRVAEKKPDPQNNNKPPENKPANNNPPQAKPEKSIEQDVIVIVKPNMFPPVDVGPYVCEPKGGWNGDRETKMRCTGPARGGNLIQLLKEDPSVQDARKD